MAKKVITNLDNLVDSVVTTNVNAQAAIEAVDNAVDAANDAAVSASESEGYKNLSRDYANKVPDSVVADGLYSARHYANKAEENKVLADNAAATATGAKNTAAQEAIAARVARVGAEDAENGAKYYYESTVSQYETFDKAWLGGHITRPTVDNQGGILKEGALYWDMHTKYVMIYTGTVWVPVKDANGSLIAANNLSDIEDVVEARSNLDVYSKEEVDTISAAYGEAIGIEYDNTNSELAATDVQSAIDEVEDRVDTLESTTTKSGDTVVLNGDVTGETTVAIDGSISITTTVVDDSHSHTKSTVTDFTETDYVHTFGDESVSGNKVFNDDVTVTGNLIINGANTTVNSTTVTTADNKILLNDGEVGAGVTAGEAGIEVDRGTAANYQIIFDEVSDTFRAGETGATQALATREDTPIDTGIAVWDDTTYRFITSKDIDVDTIVVSGTVDGRDISVDGEKLDTIEPYAKDDQSAGEVPVTPIGSIESTDVQSALEEIQLDLDTHKASTGAEHTYIDQDVTTTGTPQFASVQLTGGTGTQGRLSWNSDEETLDLVNDGAVLQLGQELHINVRNATGAAIPNGTVLMATGSLGNSGRITVAPYTSGTDIELIVGIATVDIPVDSDGKVTSFGKIRAVDTSMWSEGDILYPTNNGQLTNIEPATGPVNPLGFVVNAHTNGTLMVRVSALDKAEYRNASSINNGVLAVEHGGTGVSTSTGTGSVVLSSSPALTGTPTAPTATAGTNNTQVATTAFVSSATETSQTFSTSNFKKENK